jgi:DoxX-like family
MCSLFRNRKFHLLLTFLIGSVWVFHGLYSKLADGIPRHRQIVERILGEGIAGPATWAIGAAEVLLGLWVFSRFRRKECALVQTLALVSMNFLEILLAWDLLISAPGMVALNLFFLTWVWYWAISPQGSAISR